MYSLAIIIPCFNEAKRLNKEAFKSFSLQHPEILLVFVDDGSNDNTLNILNEIRSNAGNIHIVSLNKNKGKGPAIREGLVQTINQYNLTYIAYLDADLSISFDEFLRLYHIGLQENADIILGSKIKKIDTDIERSVFRHIMARIIATVVDTKFKLGCYDTQCGAKIFKPAIIEKAIKQPFLTRWFFDVELLVRIRKEYKHFKALEIPLIKCNTRNNSKINLFSSVLIVKEIFILLTKY